MSFDIHNTDAVVLYVRNIERQAEEAFKQKNFRTAYHCYKEAVRVTMEHLTDAMKLSPNGQASEGQVYLSESTQRWLEGMDNALTWMLPDDERAFYESFKRLLFQDISPSDKLKLAKRDLNNSMSYLVENYTEGKVPQPLFQIMHEFITGVASRRVALARLKECEVRIRKCQRLMRGYLLLDVNTTKTQQ